jgi:glutathione synthase/RimK-type ligase-like ATP-grasp enzyme
MNGVPFDIQRKASRITGSPANYQIRNYANGFIYKRQNINPPEEVINQAIEAVYAIGLHFGAVDVCWNHSLQKALVFEVNTACGLEGTTYQRYLSVLRERDYLESIPRWDQWND